ncbi:MAG: NACHT domain-containing protein [Burkholderiales bacterium]
MSPIEPPELTPAHAATLQWQLRLLGGLRAQRGDAVLTNFSSRSVAALLARLALHPQRSHAREELIEMLWPGVELDVGRNRLRQTLFTLRQLLEPPGPMAAPVLLADRLSLRLVPGAIECDVLLFERCVREGRHAQALRLYCGELLPGFYDEWIDDERVRLAALFDRASAAAVNRDRQVDTDPPASAAAAPAPATPPDIGRSTLPVYLTRFFGRDAEGARLRAEVLGHRLVTLLGPGGGGKTRLAVELAQSLREPHASQAADSAPDPRFDFVAFVPLASCETRAQVLDALLASLHLRQQDADPFEPLIAALTGRRALLVLDNFEQLTGVAEDVIARLAMRIPGLHLLVTSRRVLGLDGEREFAIQPLRLPNRALALDEAAINPAIALFVDRARAVRADFHIGPSNVAAIVELAHLLEGMPLAIELAAARARSIAPAAMAELLRAARQKPDGKALELLTRGGPRSGADLRHASMLRVIEWSWRLLDATQAQLLAAITVFQGGFSADAVRAVCGAPGANASVRLDELVAHSLLRVTETDTAATRYASFEPVREYAALQLDAAAARALRAAHRAWLTNWATTLPATPALGEVRIERENLLAALASALHDDAPDDAIRLMLPLRRVLEDVELPADGLATLAQAVERCADAALRSQGHTLLGPLLFLAGRSDDAMRHAELGLEGAPPGAPWRGRALHALARVRWRATRLGDGVTALLDEAEALARAGADDELLAGVLALRAFMLNGRREHALGEALHAQALALWERLGNQHAINSGRYNLAVCAQNANRHEETLLRLAALEPGARALQDWRRVSQLLNVRGNALSELRRWPEAVASFRECAQLAWDCLALHELAYVMWNLPRALAHVREPERAVLLAGFAEAFWRSRFGRLSEADRHDMRRVRRLTTPQIGAMRVATLWAQGAVLPLAEAMALALR